MIHEYLPDIVYYMFLLVFIFGSIGNVLQYLVYSTKKLKTLSFSIYFRFISIVDLFIMMNIIPMFLIESFDYELSSQSNFLCKTINFINYASGPISSWTLVAIGFDRMVAIVFPKRFTFLLRRNFQIMVIVFIMVVNMGYYCHVLINFRLYQVNASDENYNGTSTTIMTSSTCTSETSLLISWLDLFDSSLLPFTAMITITIVTIVYVIKSRTKMRRLSHLNDFRHVFLRDIKFGITSISLNISFLLLVAPLSTHIIFMGIYLDAHINSQVYSFFTLLFFLNYGIDFYVQLIVNSIFRKEFFKMIAFEKNKYEHSRHL